MIYIRGVLQIPPGLKRVVQLTRALLIPFFGSNGLEVDQNEIEGALPDIPDPSRPNKIVRLLLSFTRSFIHILVEISIAKVSSNESSH